DWNPWPIYSTLRSILDRFCKPSRSAPFPPCSAVCAVLAHGCLSVIGSGQCHLDGWALHASATGVAWPPSSQACSLAWPNSPGPLLAMPVLPNRPFESSLPPWLPAIPHHPSTKGRLAVITHRPGTQEICHQFPAR
uniref:Uncharacterized protein n=1 Tax=Gopherus evgoodei TaxID=1825980 RepID=A0A8C4WGE4_9SAUR